MTLFRIFLVTIKRKINDNGACFKCFRVVYGPFFLWVMNLSFAHEWILFSVFFFTYETDINGYNASEITLFKYVFSYWKSHLFNHATLLKDYLLYVLVKYKGITQQNWNCLCCMKYFSGCLSFLGHWFRINSQFIEKAWDS